VSLTADARNWLRAELAADREAIAAMPPADCVRHAVDWLLAPGLVARSTLHAVQYAINHAEPGAEVRSRLSARPIDAGCWRARDDVQASLLSVVLLALLATPIASLPRDPLLATFIAVQAVPLVVDPLHALAEVAG